MDAVTAKTCHTPIYTQTNPLAEKNTLRAVALTAVMMVLEIFGGWYYNSMALLADGWHMSSHVVALGLALGAYVLARRYAQDGRFSFGTWKVEVLGGYTSAILLLLVAGTMAYHSVERLLVPVDIIYDQAIVLAAIGLVVNLVCAWWLKDGHHHHGHEHTRNHHDGHHHKEHCHEGDHHDHHAHHTHDDTHHHKHEDLNLRAAYIHVVTDALTSVLAIVALLCGKFWGADWLDPVMGIAGSILVAIWSVGLLRDTGRALLDAEMDAPLVEKIRHTISQSSMPAQLTDLHVWRVGAGQYACALSLTTQGAISAEFYKRQLAVYKELVHVTVELNIGR